MCKSVCVEEWNHKKGGHDNTNKNDESIDKVCCLNDVVNSCVRKRTLLYCPIPNTRCCDYIYINYFLVGENWQMLCRIRKFTTSFGLSLVTLLIGATRRCCCRLLLSVHWLRFLWRLFGLSSARFWSLAMWRTWYEWKN